MPSNEVVTNRIAVTVIVDAEGVDLRDCYAVAERAVQEALGFRDGAAGTCRLAIETRKGDTLEAVVRAVVETNAALQGGVFGLTVRQQP